ncbi:MAG TPA: flagellar hook-associated protein FlgK [Stellaceae bacterium]|jgi:flagellar hook-associated protein 1 FlgK|nr:flagellar hook-associated protein FlgK [Stellaceae bacterium]
MTGLSQVIDAGSSGLNAAIQALETVSNNTSNVNTPGYDVESVQQTEQVGTVGSPGTGTDVTSIQRSFDQFVFSQMVTATSANQAAQVAQDNAENLTAIFPVASGGSGGLGVSLTNFFSGMNAVSQDPTSVADRETFLSDAQALAANFNSVGGQLSSNLASLNSQLSSAVSEVNSLTQQIANLNDQIETQSNSGGGGPPVGMMDNLDSLVQQLGQETGITVIASPSNTVNIYTTGGASLVAGSSSSNLVVTSGSYGSSTLSVTYQPTGQDISASLSGGTIGGIVSSQAQYVAAQNALGGIATALAAAVNTQQSLGLNLNGAQGGDLFSVGGPTVLADQSNTGSGTLTASITNTNAFTPDNFIVAKTASGYEATNTATGQVTALGNGPTLSLDGMTLAVSGTINTGDSFELEPTATAAQTLAVTTTDPSAIAAASPYVATAGSNLGNVTASAFSAVTSGSLPAGSVIVPASQFGQNLTVKFTSATTFNVLNSSNAVIASGSFSGTSGATLAVAYPSPPAPTGEVSEFTLSAGTPAAGDTFSLTPGGVASSSNIQAMTNLANQNLLSGETLSSAYGSLVGQVGTVGQTASFNAQAASGVLNQVQSVQQSISGVNLDQQAADLITYQQAYQASAQVIASAETLFDNLLTAIQSG